MKKNYILFAAAAIAMAASCSKEPEAPKTNVPDEEIPENYAFSAVFAPETKTVLSEGNTVIWRNGDAISVFDGDGAQGWATGFTLDARYETSSNGATAYFNATGGEGNREVTDGKSVYFAMTPRVGDAACDVENSIITTWISNRQKGIKGAFSEVRGTTGRHMSIAVAKTTDPKNEPFMFYNVVSLLKVVVPEELDGKVTRIGVHARGGEYIGGDIAVDMSGTTPLVSLRKNLPNGSGSAYGDMYLYPDSKSDLTITGATFEAGTYYISLYPADLKDGFVVDYQLDTDARVGEIACQKQYGPIKLERSHIYNLGSIMAPGESVPATGEGITGLPYVFSFFDSEQKNDTPKYITKGSLTEKEYSGYVSGNSYKQYSGVAATDNSFPAVKLELSNCVYYQLGSSAAKTSNKTLNQWAQVNGHDNFNTKCLCSYYSVSGLPFDCGWYLNVPLAADLPQKFNVSFGDCLGGDWGLNKIALFFSYDKRQWTCAKSFRMEKTTASGKFYYYYTAEIDAPKQFKAGTMLYLKMVTIGSSVLASNSPSDGFGTAASPNGQHRFHSCIAITPADVPATTRPSGLVFFEPFDSFKGGLDYMIGEKLAGMANLCGGEASLSGFTANKVYERPGYAQLGFVDSQSMASDNDMTTTNHIGSLTTPALGQAGNLELSFKACAYLNPAANRTGHSTAAKNDAGSPDITSILVNITGGGTIDGATSVRIDNIPTDAWQTVTKTISGATADTKIEFTSPEDGLFHRWFLDEISVKIAQ